MASRKKRFRYESLHDSKSIQSLLKAITAGIAKGKLTFSDGDEKIVMRPGGMLDLKISATQEDGRNRFNIRVSWQADDERASGKKSLSVK
jgi:amphi-Trp domain-containing protein